jgi:hypothetical protein
MITRNRHTSLSHGTKPMLTLVRAKYARKRYAMYSWSGYCATNRKVIENSHGLNPSGRAMALGSTPLQTEMSTRVISCGGGGG